MEQLQLFNQKQVAGLLGMNATSLAGWVQKRLLPGPKVRRGKRRLYDRAGLEELIEKSIRLRRAGIIHVRPAAEPPEHVEIPEPAVI